MSKNKLSPLPVGNTGSLQPLNGVKKQESPVDSPRPNESEVNAVDKWLADNPETPPTDPKPVEQPASEPAPAAEPTPAQPQGNAKPAVEPVQPKPSAQPTGSEPAKPAVSGEPASQPTPAPKTYAADEKFALAEGVEWSREQLVGALRERVELQKLAPFKAEAEELKKIFGVASLDQAKQNWAPLLERLHGEPQTTAFIDGYLSDPSKAQYLEQCAAAFDRYVAENPEARTTETRPGVPGAKQETEEQKAIRELQEWKTARQKQETDERVSREWSQVTNKYPWIAADKAIQQDLFATAQYLYAQDPSKGLLDALALKAAYFDQITALRAPQQPVQPAAQPQVPALLGSSGASPTATRASHSQSSDPVERWLGSADSRKFGS